MALKFTVHVVQSFIKGHRKSGVISMKHFRDNYNSLRMTATDSARVRSGLVQGQTHNKLNNFGCDRVGVGTCMGSYIIIGELYSVKLM